MSLSVTSAHLIGSYPDPLSAPFIVGYLYRWISEAKEHLVEKEHLFF